MLSDVHLCQGGGGQRAKGTVRVQFALTTLTELLISDICPAYTAMHVSALACVALRVWKARNALHVWLRMTRWPVNTILTQ